MKREHQSLEDRLTLTPVEAAALVGCRAEWIREAVRRGELPARRFGNRIKISRDALEEWLRRGDDHPMRSA